MTDTDPIIAEIERTITIQGPRGGELEAETGVLEVCLSDAPLVEDLLEAAKEGYVTAVCDWGAQRGLMPLEALRAFGERFKDGNVPMGWRHAGRLRAAIRAIEPEWTP